jgi:hypothetical protein
VRAHHLVLRDLVQANAEPDRPWLEFGVSTGHTLRWMGVWTKNQVYGFDTFTGLPEDWLNPEGTVRRPKGYFACDEVPTDFSDNVHTVVGRFQDTLPDWLKTHGQPFGFVHIDCDLYSSTKFVLDELEPYLDKTVIALDEVRGEPTFDFNEGRAWCEWLSKDRYEAVLVGHQHENGAIYKLHRK